MVKIIFKIFIITLIVGCAMKPVSNESTPAEPIKPSPVNELPRGSIETVPPVVAPALPPPTQTPSHKAIPKIAIIFSGGGAKSWAHIGVIKEIEKAKWPIHSVGGFEWGSVVAAIYANNFSSNEVEWELSKVKDFENVEEISNLLFDKKSVADLKVPFVCPSLNIATQVIYLLNRGQLNKLIPFCLAHPPLSKPYASSVAEMHDISAIAQHLRATGANKIVLINVLSQNSKHPFTHENLSAENILWAESAALMAKKINGVDDVVNINLDTFGIKELENRREIIAKGSELGYDEIRKLTLKYGL